MAQLRVNCPQCGDITIWAQAVTMRVAVPGLKGAYWYTCPDCEQTVVKPLTNAVYTALSLGGVKPIRVQRHATPDPPLTEDDLIEFGRQIEALL